MLRAVRWLGRKLRETALTARQLPSPVWIACLLHMLDGFAYFAISTNLTIYLTTNFGLSDMNAGIVYGIWGALLVAFGIPTGFLIDKFGIQKSLLIGALFNVVARTVFALTDSLVLVLGALFIGTTIGSGFFISVLHVAVNRYTEKNSKLSGFAFALLYTAMNVGAIGAMVGTDMALALTLYFEGYRLLFVVGAAASVLQLVISVVYKEPKSEESLAVEEEVTLRRCAGVLLEKSFWRLIGINVFCIGVRSMFRHWETLLPKWLTRVYPGIHYGTLLALNPILIIPFTPLVNAITQHFSQVYWVLVAGTLFSALSPLPPWLWVSQSTAPMLLSICLFTIPGEAVYSPKLGQVTLERSPAGKKGIYSGLIPIPYFAGNIFSGLFSGWLLDSYCPDPSESSSLGGSLEFSEARANECSKVWGWVILTAVTSPILLAAFKKLLDTEEDISVQYERFREEELQEFNDTQL